MRQFATMFKLVVGVVLLATVYAVDFEIRNKEIGAIWVGIQGNDGKTPLAGGGFILEAGASTDWNAGVTEELPPASLAEITLHGWGDLDYYDISLVDGFNIPVAFEPVNGNGDGSQYSCAKAKCEHHYNDDCPAELQLTTEHGVVGCKSACLAFDTDEYCCRGSHGTPETCKSSDWAQDYPAYFKKWCPDAYSYAYDDHKSTFTCQASKYIVTFGI
ncbi:hypothetical protein NQ315_006508 [Exocentrus adspersus]|uniref:Thaumatin-like protein n=1 Tax=Exocentrus adspersus TaxID=1586481 RepID=A0AAV8W043_9CUCU|nr:hypothetical protein NQ315_006508 [Exocentrus adspersus]